jgi:hypothetical protein
MQLSRGKSGLVSITTHKDRPGWLTRPRAAELEIRSDPDTHALTWQFNPVDATAEAGEPWKPTTLMERVRSFLQEQSEPVSLKTVEDNVKGKSREWIRKAVDALVAEGSVKEARGAHNARMLSSPSSPDIAQTSPGEDTSHLAQFAHPLQGGELQGEDKRDFQPSLAEEARGEL